MYATVRSTFAAFYRTLTLIYFRPEKDVLNLSLEKARFKQVEPRLLFTQMKRRYIREPHYLVPIKTISRWTLTCLLALAPYARATDSTPISTIETVAPATFNACVTNLKQRAENQGISKDVIDRSLTNISLNPKVLEYDRKQPEFSESFATYFNKRVSPWRIEQGKLMRQKYLPLLLELQAKYGIPPHYLISFWGLETNFGSYKGKLSIIRSLTTLACDPRRSAFFTTELMLALKLVERESLNPMDMLGSWAGAMGHTQFMPSAYHTYAVDGDGDGKIDLWHSVPDALTSAANFLHNLGWKRGFRWGREVLLAKSFNYHYSGLDNARGLNDWRKIGVTLTNGKAMAASDIKAALIVPSGHMGPAFLVYDNFHVIMRWNNSQFYAIAVGHLADRIAGAVALQQPPISTPNLSVVELLSLQQKLTSLGFDVGKPDGIMGPATQKGIRDFQFAHDMVADGFPHKTVFEALGISVEAANPTAKQSL